MVFISNIPWQVLRAEKIRDNQRLIFSVTEAFSLHRCKTKRNHSDLAKVLLKPAPAHFMKIKAMISDLVYDASGFSAPIVSSVGAGGGCWLYWKTGVKLFFSHRNSLSSFDGESVEVAHTAVIFTSTLCSSYSHRASIKMGWCTPELLLLEFFCSFSNLLRPTGQTRGVRRISFQQTGLQMRH